MSKSKKKAIQVIKNPDGTTKSINHNKANAGTHSKKTGKRFRGKRYL